MQMFEKFGDHTQLVFRSNLCIISSMRASIYRISQQNLSYKRRFVVERSFREDLWLVYAV